MRGSLWIAAGGMLLAGVVAVGTGLLVAGTVPPAPWSGRLFQAVFAVTVIYALAFGRPAR